MSSIYRVLRARLTYANVVATVALFLALGGASYAMLRVPKNSVGTPQLRDRAVTAPKLAPGAVTATSVRRGSLTGVQVVAATLGKVRAAARADSAATADAVGGVPVSGLLRSDQVMTGTASDDSAGNVILKDPGTGVEVLTGVAGALRLVNTNGQDTILGEGAGFYAGQATPNASSFSLAPGDKFDLAYNAASFTYGQYEFFRPNGGAVLQLTCLERSTTGSEFVTACMAVR